MVIRLLPSLMKKSDGEKEALKNQRFVVRVKGNL